MIFGTLADWQEQVTGPVWEKAFEYLTTLTQDTPEGKTFLQGEEMFGIVMSYETWGRDKAIIETHDRYIDIQIVLAGSEGMDCFPRGMLEVSDPYDAENDRTFYTPPEAVAPVFTTLAPGQFVIYRAEDAHRCQLVVGDSPVPVKKVVVKVARALLD